MADEDNILFQFTSSMRCINLYVLICLRFSPVIQTYREDIQCTPYIFFVRMSDS